MNKAMKYLTPKKPISKIARDRAEEMEERNVDLYEAIAGLFEELAALEQSNAELKARKAVYIFPGQPQRLVPQYTQTTLKGAAFAVGRA